MVIPGPKCEVSWTTNAILMIKNILVNTVYTDNCDAHVYGFTQKPVHKLPLVQNSHSSPELQSYTFPILYIRVVRDTKT